MTPERLSRAVKALKFNSALRNSVFGRIRSSLKAALLALPLLFCGISSPAAVLDCTVARVLDGDTLDCDNRRGRYRIRLRSIDAPEKSQPGAGPPAKTSGGMSSENPSASISRGRIATAGISALCTSGASTSTGFRCGKGWPGPIAAIWTVRIICAGRIWPVRKNAASGRIPIPFIPRITGEPGEGG